MQGQYRYADITRGRESGGCPLTWGKLPLNCLPSPFWVFHRVVLLVFYGFFCCDQSFHCFMQMIPFRLNGKGWQPAGPPCCKLEDWLRKAAKCVREEVALPVPRKLRHQNEGNWRSWSSEEKTAAVQLVKTAGYNHLRLKHGKDTPPKATVVISQGIWASQKLSRGSLLHLSELQDPRTLGNLLIFGLYSKPIAYCYSLLLLGTPPRAQM